MTRLEQSELTAIASIESILAVERDPHLAVLLRGLRDSHQDAFGRLASLGRLDVPTPGSSARIVLRASGLEIAAQLRGAATLRALRQCEEDLEQIYADARDQAERFERRAFGELEHKATQRRILLVAHIAQARGKGSTVDLPKPLGDYFASNEHRTCMRCLLDRPGTQSALLRTAPHTFLCSGCHDDTLRSFPPDIAALAPRWSDEARENRVLANALTRASKRRVEDEVHTVLAGQPPKLHPRGTELPRGLHRAGPSGPTENIATVLDRSREAATSSERAYDELLFDYRSLRRYW